MKIYISGDEKRFLYFSLLKKGYSPSQAKSEMELLKSSQKEISKHLREEKSKKSKKSNENFKESFNKLKEAQNGERIN